MTFRFVARAAGAEIGPDGDLLAPGFAEEPRRGGFGLQFRCDDGEPDDQDGSFGMDTHCLVSSGQGTAYGGGREAVLSSGVLRVSLDPSAHVAGFREVLPRVPAYARQDARPERVEV